MLMNTAFSVCNRYIPKRLLIIWMN